MACERLQCWSFIDLVCLFSAGIIRWFRFCFLITQQEFFGGSGSVPACAGTTVRSGRVSGQVLSRVRARPQPGIAVPQAGDCLRSALESGPASFIILSIDDPETDNKSGPAAASIRLPLNSALTPKLNIAKVLLGAVLIPWHQRRQFAHALLVPMVFLVVMVMVWRETYTSIDANFAWLASAAYGFLFILLAVRCHRLMLLTEPVEEAWTLPHWSVRETRFLVRVALVWLCCVAVFFIAQTLGGLMVATVMDLASETIAPAKLAAYSEYAGDFAYWFVFGRLSLIFPGTAIDDERPLLYAWQRSRGNGWRLFVVVCVVPFCASQLVEQLVRQDATLLEYALLTALGVVFIAFEVAALSLAYRQLVLERDGEIEWQ